MTTAPTLAPSRPQSTIDSVAGRRLPSLTGARVLAGLAVFSTHVMALQLFADPKVAMRYAQILGNVGSFGIGFFFVLTGFVVTWTAQRGDSAKAFWRRRFLKLYPNHAVVWAIVLAMFLMSGTVVHAAEATSDLFLVQAWVPDENFLLHSVNGPTWSLNIDVLAYAAFPLLYWLVVKIRPNRLWFWAIGAILLVALLPEVTKLLFADHPASIYSPTASAPRHWFAYYFPLTRSLEFMVGILMSRIVLTGRWIGLTILPAALLTIAIYLVSMDVTIFDGYTSIPLVAMALLVPAIATSDAKGHRTILNSKPMVWVGERMYAFFLIHITVLFSIHALFSGQWGVSAMYKRQTFGTLNAFLLLAGIYVLCVALASILYALVERPVMRRWARAR